MAALGEPVEAEVELGRGAQPDVERDRVVDPVEVEGVEIARIRQARVAQRNRKDGVVIEVRALAAVVAE